MKNTLFPLLALLAISGCVLEPKATTESTKKPQYASEEFSIKLSNSIKTMPQRSRDRLKVLGEHGTPEEKADFVRAQQYTLPPRLENIYRSSRNQSSIPSDRENARNCHRVCEIRDDCPEQTCCQVCWTECECSPGYAC